MLYFVRMKVLIALALMLQIPQDIPHQTEPVDFSQWQNVLIYLIVPLLLVVSYFFYFRKKKNKR
jgi:LPXTG-motif cell wall-anchored protein